MRAGWILHPRNLIAYGLVALAAILTYRFHVTPWIAATAVGALIVAYYLVMPMVAMRGLEPLDRELNRLLVSGKGDAALALWNRRILLRLFGPPAVTKLRLGRIHAARTAWRPAFAAYHEALGAAREKDPFALRLGHAEAGFHCGEDAAIQGPLLGLSADQRSPVVVGYMIVHVVLSGGGKTETARQVLDKWKDRASGDQDAAVMGLAEAEILEHERRRRDAAERLDKVKRRLLPQAIAPLADLLEGRLAYFDGRREEAERLFAGVRASAAGGRAHLELGEFLEAMGKAGKGGKAVST